MRQYRFSVSAWPATLSEADGGLTCARPGFNHSSSDFAPDCRCIRIFNLGQQSARRDAAKINSRGCVDDPDQRRWRLSPSRSDLKGGSGGRRGSYELPDRTGLALSAALQRYVRAVGTQADMARTSGMCLLQPRQVLAYQRRPTRNSGSDVGGDAPGLVAGEQLGRRASFRITLEVYVGERLPVGVADNESTADPACSRPLDRLGPRFICSDQSFSRTAAVSSFDSSGAGASPQAPCLPAKNFDCCQFPALNE